MKRIKIGIGAICLFLFTGAFAQSNEDNQLPPDETQVEIKANDAPPPLPQYEQPPCPVEGYLWTPGYWGYGAVGRYYWVPGVWVGPPHVGFLWTPGYWGFYSGYYGWHRGYWGEHIGFYGGVNYGFGYGGVGFYGGRWEGGAFRYNTAVCRVNTAVIHNTYVNNTVVTHNEGVRASFNGRGGVVAQPAAEERVAMKENHMQATGEQQSHQASASHDRRQLASVNKGTPGTTAMSKPGGEHFSPSGTATHSNSPNGVNRSSQTTRTSPAGSPEGRQTREASAPNGQRQNTAPRTNTAGSNTQRAAGSNAPRSNAQRSSAPRSSGRSATRNSAPRSGGHGGGGHRGGGSGHGGGKK